MAELLNAVAQWQTFRCISYSLNFAPPIHYVYSSVAPSSFAPSSRAFVCPYTMQVNSAPTRATAAPPATPLRLRRAPPSFCGSTVNNLLALFPVNQHHAPRLPAPPPLHLSCIVCGKNRTERNRTGQQRRREGNKKRKRKHNLNFVIVPGRTSLPRAADDHKEREGWMNSVGFVASHSFSFRSLLSSSSVLNYP